MVFFAEIVFVYDAYGYLFAFLDIVWKFFDGP